MKKLIILFLAIFTVIISVYTYDYCKKSTNVSLISGIHSGISPQEAKDKLGLKKWAYIDESAGRDGVNDLTVSAEPYIYCGCRGTVTMCFIGGRLYRSFFFPLSNSKSCQGKIAKLLSLEYGEWDDGFVRIEQFNSFNDGTYTVWTDKRLFNKYGAWIDRNG